jgi:uncharacterized membrane protein
MNSLHSDPTIQRGIDAYLMRLKSSLKGLPAQEVTEIVREIGGHIAERLESSGETGEPALAQVLHGLGEPQAIASQYQTRAMLVRARASSSPTLIFLATLRWGMRSLAGALMCLVGFAGYALTLGFLGCALLKPIQPDHVGMWALGTIVLIVTTRILRWTLRRTSDTAGVFNRQVAS